MEKLQKEHRQEQKNLQSRITQKKKAATKRTRKGVNDECADLERQLEDKQRSEIAAFSGHSGFTAVDDEITNGNESGEQDSPETSVVINSASESLPLSSTSASNGAAKRPNRQKARLARRAAEQEIAAEQASREAANQPNLRDEERRSMLEAYASRGLTEYEIRSDGHCLYAAVADQMQDKELSLKQDGQLKSGSPLPEDYKVTRHVAAMYIFEHPDDFIPFLEGPLDQYVKTISETGEWGGHLEILALAKAYGVDINILQGDGKVEKIECGVDGPHPELWLAYYRHSFGLGEHYNSLRKAG